MAPAALQMSKKKRALVISVKYFWNEFMSLGICFPIYFFLMKYRSNLVDTPTEKAAEYTALEFT
jgi:hypothetical protein